MAGHAHHELEPEPSQWRSEYEPEKDRAAFVAKFGFFAIILLLLASVGIAITNHGKVPPIVVHHSVTGEEHGDGHGHGDGDHGAAGHTDAAHSDAAHDDAAHKTEPEAAPAKVEEPKPQRGAMGGAPMPTTGPTPIEPPAEAPKAEAPKQERSEAAGEAALKKLEADKSISGQELVDALNLCVINFNSGSAELDAKSKTLLQEAAKVIKKAEKGSKIEIGGYTDSSGDATKNQKLSLDRAKAVWKALSAYGCDPAAFEYKGYGSNNPIADNKSDAGRAKNRRMEFVLLTK